MGLFSKLLGKAVNDAAADMFGNEKHYFDNLRNDDAPQQPAAPAAKQPLGSSKPVVYGDMPWGELMPAEENQYSFNGSYIQYFEKVFAEEFPSYQISHAPAGNGRITVFTFMNGGRKALVVELLSERCSVYKLRNQCLNEGIPYLRFYYDHDGWWNTRSYVAGRVRGALSV